MKSVDAQHDMRLLSLFKKKYMTRGHPIHELFKFSSTFPAMTNWLTGQPGADKCVQMASRRRKVIDNDEITEHVDTGWETVHCNKGTFFLCQDLNDVEESFENVWFFSVSVFLYM